MLLTRIFSDNPGTPGRKQQMPRGGKRRGELSSDVAGFSDTADDDIAFSFRN